MPSRRRSMDYRDFLRDGVGKRPSELESYAWWELEGKQQADSITAVLDIMYHQESSRAQQYVLSARLYGNAAMMGPVSTQYSRITQTLPPGQREKVSFNIVQSTIDTATAKLTRNKPRPLFLTSGGDWKHHRKAKKLNRFIEGVFHHTRTREVAVIDFRDGCVWGDGIVNVTMRNGKIAHDRVLASELHWDEIEAFYGDPRQIHRVRQVDKYKLAAIPALAKKRKAIMDAAEPTMEEYASQPHVANLVTIRESWHLPSAPGADDGWYVLSIEEEVLVARPWKHDYFPFARFQWSPRLFGWGGQGLAEQIQPIQIEHNRLMFFVQRAQYMGAGRKILVENSSKIVDENFDNKLGTIIRYSGTKPEYILPPIVPPEIYAYLPQLRAAGYEQSGISQLAASAVKPAGLNAGVALREYNDLGADRMQTIGARWEQFHLDIARLDIATIKDFLEDEKQQDYKVQVPGRNFLEEIDWKDIDLDEDQYVMQCFPVSSLPNEPAGRLQTVTEYMQSGLVTPRQGKRLLDFPDLEQMNTLASAAEEYLTMVLDKLVDEGVYTPPEPFDDLALGRELALEYYQIGRCHGLGEAELEMLRRYMQTIDAMLQPPTPMLAGSGAGPDAGLGEPQAQPEPPPTNPMIPNVPGMQPAGAGLDMMRAGAPEM